MAEASSRFAEYLARRPYAGALADADAVGGANADDRPPGVAVFLKVREGRIADAGYQASGCGYLIACCSALMDLAIGRTIPDCEQLTEVQLIEHIGSLPEHRQYCAELAVRALHNTLARLPASSSQIAEEAA